MLTDDDYKNLVVGPIVTRDIENKILSVEIKDLNGIRPDKREDAVKFIIDRINIFFDEIAG